MFSLNISCFVKGLCEDINTMIDVDALYYMSLHYRQAPFINANIYASLNGLMHTFFFANSIDP